jgi:HAD superfamily hydrolase (TIGR01509 family)
VTEVSEAVSATAVVFDLDGLLVDSEPVWYEVEYAAVERLGGQWSHEHQAACVGGTMDRSCAYIIELTGADIAVDELGAQLFDAMVQRFRDGLPLQPGALELLDKVAAAGVDVGLVTSSYRVLVDVALDTLGRDRFAVVVTGDEITHGKPHPEPFTTACAALGADPGRVVVLEDAMNGVLSAEAAGCVVVAVPSVAPIPATPRRPVVDSLLDIDVDWLLALPQHR